MLAFVGPLLAAAVMAQVPGDTIRNQVIDEQGKPVAGAQVDYYEPPPAESQAKAVVARTETDAQGRFVLSLPPPPRTDNLFMKIWAYHPGSAITAERFSATGPALVLQSRSRGRSASRGPTAARSRGQRFRSGSSTPPTAGPHRCPSR